MNSMKVYKAVIQDVLICSCRHDNGKNYLTVVFDEKDGHHNDLIDKDLSREKYYTRGAVMDLDIKITKGWQAGANGAKGYYWANMEIIDARLKSKEGEA